MHLPRSLPLTERVCPGRQVEPGFAIFVSSFAPSPVPTEDLKMTVGIRGTPFPLQWTWRPCSRVLLSTGAHSLLAGLPCLAGRWAWQAFWWLSTVTG